MSEDYKNGLVTGLAMQPLYVVAQQEKKASENICGAKVVPLDMMSDDGRCKFIDFEED